MAADLWIFLTTAARYADAVPWQLLHTARDRGTAIAIVLDRCPPEAVKDVGGHLSEMLAANGLGGAPLFVIAEQSLRGGRLREKATAPIRSWLASRPLTRSSGPRWCATRWTGHSAAFRLGRTRLPTGLMSSPLCASSWNPACRRHRTARRPG